MTTTNDVENETVDSENETDVENETVDTPSVEKENKVERTPEEQIAFLTQASRQHEARSRSNLKKLKEAQEALDTALAEREQFAAQLETLKTEAKNTLKANIALKFGLNETLASRLQGETQEELEADATSLAEILKPTTNKKPNNIQGVIKSKLEASPSRFQQAQANRG